MKLPSALTHILLFLRFFFFFLLLLLLLFLLRPAFVGGSKSEIPIGYQLTLSIPSEYVEGFIGKALLMQTDQHNGSTIQFTTALIVEAVDGRFACSLDLFLGAVRVWSSGHRSKFYTTGICVLELTQHGDLRLKGPPGDQVGWRTGTTEQAVQKLQLLDSGNLVLVDALQRIKWQTFNFPTNTLLWGQRLSVATHLTSYPTNTININDSSSNYYYYSLEIRHDKLALYLNTLTVVPHTHSSNKHSSTLLQKYWYWELVPSRGKNITFVELTSQGLELYDDKFLKFAQIDVGRRPVPHNSTSDVRFMALDNTTGNLGIYCSSTAMVGGGGFEPCFEAIGSACDLPLACPSNYSVCTASGSCSCLSLGTVNRPGTRRISSTLMSSSSPDCDEEGSTENELTGFCVKDGEENDAEMIQVEGVTNVFRGGSSSTSLGKGNVSSMSECVGLCLDDCGCRALLYTTTTTTITSQQLLQLQEEEVEVEVEVEVECVLYDRVIGLKQIVQNNNSNNYYNYMVKVPKGTGSGSGKGLKKWMVVLVVVGDAFILFLVLGGIAYFVVWKRRRKTSS